MITAKNSVGKTVHISEVERSEPCFCKLCNQPLIQKKGKERRAHFAHYPTTGKKGNYTPCVDSWSHDMSDWHMDWQNRYDNNCIERVMEDNTGKHIADVFVGNVVIEFQHSPLSYEEFEERNNFYHKKGFRIIWVFDVVEEFENEYIAHSYGRNDGYTWSNPRKPLRNIEQFESPNLAIYLQFDDDFHSGCLERVIKGYRSFTSFYTDEKQALSIDEFIKRTKENPDLLFKKEIIEKPILEVTNGKTIFEIWKPDSKFTFVQNLSDKTVVMRIDTYDESIYRDRYGNIMGKYAKKDDRGFFRGHGDYYRVKNADKPIWKLIYQAKDNNYENRQESKRIALEEQRKKFEEEIKAAEQKREEELRVRRELQKRMEDQARLEEEEEKRKNYLKNMPVHLPKCHTLFEILRFYPRDKVVIRNEYTKRTYLLQRTNAFKGYVAYEVDPISGDIDKEEADISYTPTGYSHWSILSPEEQNKLL